MKRDFPLDFLYILPLFTIFNIPKIIIATISVENHIDQKLSKLNTNQNIVYPDEAVLFHQSELCREEEIRNNLQCFKELPDENYEVLVGENVIIKCLVANQKGKAQWRVGDRMLGFNREIPFKPRFSMIGDEESGDQSLKIENVSTTDAGEYECQVTRGNLGKKELRKATRLIVLVPPSTPLIYENNNKQPSASILITISSKANENQSKKLNLKCVSIGGQPDPTFEWFHNNQLLKDHDLSVKISDFTFKSYLTMGITQLMNGDSISCVVFNKATLRNSETNQHKLKTSVSIAVNTLPGSPKIIDGKNKITIIEDKSLSISCQSQPAGEPHGIIKWNWSDGASKLFDNNIYLITKEWIKDYIDSGILISRITIPKIDRKYHGLYLVCRLNHELLEDQIDQIQIFVEHSPENITIDSSVGKPRNIIKSNNEQWNNIPVVYAQPHQKLLFQCSTSKYYGEIDLSWYVYEGIKQNKKKWKLLDRVQPKENIVDSGLRRTQISKFEIVHSAEKSVVMKCELKFKNSYKLSNLVMVETIQMPTIPVLKADKDYITDNSDVTLTCFTIGGNPAPSLKLYKGNQEVLAEFKRRESKKIELIYKFRARKSMNMDTYKCGITSPFRIFDHLKNTEIIIKIFYAPTKLILSSPTENSMRSGNYNTFRCQTDESNPASEIKWTKYECQNYNFDQDLDRKSLLKCQAKSIESTYTVTIGKWNGSFIMQSTIKLLLTETDNNNILECSINSFSNSNIELQKTMKLNVKHPPIFKKDIQYDYVVIEGQPISIHLSPIANPPVQMYQWLSEGSSIPSSRALRVHENYFIIIRSDVDMMRNYTLTARNEIGTGSFTFRLNVTFGARMIGPDSEVVSVKLDDKNAKLICKAQSNPTGSQTKVTWLMLDKGYNWRLLNKERQEIITISPPVKCDGDQWLSLAKYRALCVSTSNIEIMSTLQISNLVPSDMGRYQCFVNNTIESAASKILNLNVPVGARIINSRRRQFSGGELRQSAKLFCWVFGFPKPKVIWYRDTSNLTLISGKKFQYEMERMGGGLYNSILTVNFIENLDYTNYFCQASNEIGISTSKIKMLQATKPDIPYSIRVVNITMNNITVEWMQGFNGGSEQIFIVKWKPINIFNSEIHSAEIIENLLDEKLFYTIKDLSSANQYEIRVCSKNKKIENCQYASPLLVKTSKNSATDESGIYSTSSFISIKDRSKSDNIVITITSISVFVFVILVINILFVSFYIRKRRNKNSQNTNENKMEHSLGYIPCSNMEMYPALNTNTRGSSINEISTNNSQRSLDSIKNNMKNNNDQLPGSMGVINPNHRVQVSMINCTPNHSTSICYQTNTPQRDKVLMYPSSIDGNHLNQTLHSHTLQNISLDQSIHNNPSLTPYSSLLHQSSIVNSPVQPEIQNNSIGIPIQLSPIRLPLEPDQICAAGGLLIPVNHLIDHINYSTSKCDYPIYQKYIDDRYLSNDTEKHSNPTAYSISYSGTIPHYRQTLYNKHDSNISTSYELNYPNHSMSYESQFSKMTHPNDSASNSSTSSNLKRYGELSVVFNRPYNTDSSFLEDKLIQSFEDDILDTAV